MIRFRTAALLAASYLTPLAAQTTTVLWQWKNPLPQGNTLHAVAVLPDRSIITAGAGGAYMRSTDDGQSWVPNFYIAGLRSFSTVAFPVQTTGTVTGEASDGTGRVVRTTNGGQAWTMQTTNTIAPLASSHFMDADNGWIVGDGGTVLSTTNGGSTWTSETLSGFPVLNAVRFQTLTRGLIGASAGKMYAKPSAAFGWQIENTGQTNDVLAVDIHAGLAIAVIGGGQGFLAWKSTDLASWTSTTSPHPAETMRAARFLSEHAVLMAGSNGSIIRSTDAGRSWTSVHSGGGQTLRALHSLDTSLVVAVGGGGTMLRSTDAGRSFVQLSSGNRASINAAAAGGSGVVAVGSGGVIFRRNAASGAWDTVASGTSQSLLTALSLGDSTFVAAGASVILRSVDAGLTWVPVVPPVSSSFRGASMRGSIALLAASNGSVLRSTDRGASWTEIPTGDIGSLRATAFATDSVAIAVGQDRIIRSNDGGVTWSAITPPTTALQHAVAFGDALRGFAAGSALDAGLPPTLNRTTDGGLTWETVFLPTTTFSMNTVQFRTEEVLVAGSEGVVFRSTDAGATWTRLLVGTGLAVNGLARMNDRWVAVGAGGMVLESPSDPSSVDDHDIGRNVPASPLVVSAYPNPFNPATTVEFRSVRSGEATVEVYNLLGQRVAVLFTGHLQAGVAYRSTFEPGPRTAGVYFLRVVQGHHQAFRKLLFVP